MRYQLVLLLALICQTSYSQWSINGTGLPADSHFVSPRLQYSAFHNRFYTLTHPIDNTPGYRVDTMYLEGTNWGNLDTNLTESVFIASANGDLVFVSVDNGNLKLTGKDHLGQPL